MMDNWRDVLSQTGPNWGAESRLSLTPKQKVDYGLYPRVYLFPERWGALYTALWRAAGRFFRKHQQHGVR